MASSKVDEPVDEPVLPQKETFGTFFFNKKEKTVLGRTAGSWAKIGLFYLIYYGCLAGWFAGLLNAFYSTLDERIPKHYGKGSLTKANPGLGLRPMPIESSTLIRFKMGIPSSYLPYTEHMKSFLSNYDSPEGAIQCTDDGSMRTDGTPNATTNGCLFDVNEALAQAGCDAKDFGYFDGEPCVLIKVNKLFDFQPEPYPNLATLLSDIENSTSRKDNDMYKDKPPSGEQLAFSDGRVGVSCMGQNEIDRAHLTVIDAYPKGIDLKYFPYLNQQGYRAPFVAFKLKPVLHEVVQVACKLWAENVDNSDGQEKRGTVHFELLID